MLFNGRDLKTGAEYYSAAMDVMQHEERATCVFTASKLFLAGAEMGDRFCKARLKEILTTRRYLRPIRLMLSPEIMESIKRVYVMERDQAWYHKVFLGFSDEADWYDDRISVPLASRGGRVLKSSFKNRHSNQNCGRHVHWVSRGKP